LIIISGFFLLLLLHILKCILQLLLINNGHTRKIRISATLCTLSVLYQNCFDDITEYQKSNCELPCKVKPLPFIFHYGTLPVTLSFLLAIET